VEGAGAVGVGNGLGLHLLKGGFWVGDLGNLCLKVLDFLCYLAL